MNIYWLGGSPCSGKSSMAALLAERYGLRVYSVDASLGKHVPHLTAARQPVLYKWHNTPWNDLWMQPPDLLLAEVTAAYAEHCSLVIEDVAALPTDRPLLVEGTCLLPACVLPHLAGPRHGLWVVSTEAFQRMQYPQRGAWVQGILQQCADPDSALRNWMDRDVTFARWVADEARARGLRVMQVDGSRTIAQGADEVAADFGWSGHAPAA
ncbi:MAG: hypothetical protein IT329_15575 [Caldilineaceae bacterium]|nr:hypothetical protein [Caldilineaceae bacterium]